jgi:hypothetical protein
MSGILALALVLLAADPVVATPDAPESQSAQRMAEKLAELRVLFEQLECEKLVTLAPAIEDHRLATQVERHEAMFRRGYCLVVMGNTGEADGLFRDIMREEVTAKPTFAVEPRVLALVEAARNEIVNERAAAREAARQKVVEKISFEISGTPNVKGGNRVFFDVLLTDPDHVVKSMRVDFRKQGSREYYALPVSKRADGRWRGEVPGTYTRSSTGMKLEWFLTLSDDAGEPLKAAGARDKPNVLEVLPGSAIAEDLHADERAPQATRFVAGMAVTPFFTFVGVAGGLIVAVGVDQVVSFIPGGVDAANVLGGLALLTMPVGMGAGMVFLLETAILDAPDSWIATGIVGTFLLLGELCLLLDSFDRGGEFVSHTVSQGFRDDSNEDRTGPPGSPLVVYAGAFVVLGALAGAIATPTLVSLDPPEE